jgi:hypothetical protein
MQVMLHFCEWLEHNSWIIALDSNVPLSLFFEIMHYSGFFLVVGTTVIVDLRILGLAGRSERPSELSQQLVPWMWTGLVMATVSGFFMFSADAADFYLAGTFRLKILVVVLAAIFGAVVQRKTSRWGELPSIPAGAKFVAFISLVLWIGAILASVEVPAISGVG